MSASATNRKSRKTSDPEMRPEYDFSNAVRGKYYKRYRESTNVVVLEPDVAKRFKNAADVNAALRSIAKVEGKRRSLTRPSTRTRSKRA